MCSKEVKYPHLHSTPGEIKVQRNETVCGCCGPAREGHGEGLALSTLFTQKACLTLPDSPSISWPLPVAVRICEGLGDRGQAVP